MLLHPPPHVLLRRAYVLALGVMCIAAGCLSPGRALRESNRVGNRLAADYRKQVAGTNASFAVQRPSDRLRARLMEGQRLPGLAEATVAVSNAVPDPLRLSLADALRAGARNDARYQALKETVFEAALELDLQQHAFESTLTGLLSGGVVHEKGADGASSSRATGSAKGGLARTFVQGTTVAANLAWDVASLLTGGGGTTRGLVGDATVTVPLLRGAGREVVREPLTQAESDLLYALHDFEAYRQEYAVKTATAYYGVLEAAQQVQTLQDNERRLSDSHRRAQMLFDAGRMPQLQIDQTRQDLLSTGDKLVRARQSLETKFDELKGTLGLPADARVEVEPAELERLEQAGGVQGAAAPPARLPWTEEQAIGLALSNRHDVAVAHGRLVDAQRGVRVAADGLRMDLTLTASGQADSRRAAAGGARTRTRSGEALLEADLPWERTAERNAYRSALLARDAALRAVEAAEDAAKSAVRAGLRNVQAAWSTCAIQSEAVTVATRRVDSSTLFQQAGRAEMRDVLEAQEALLNARNAQVSAIVRYRLAGLELRRDLALLELTEEGLWGEPDTDR